VIPLGAEFEQEEKETPETVVIAGRGPFPLRPDQVLPAMPGKYGITLFRVFCSTTIFAFSLGIMRAVPNMGMVAFVIPLWCMALGSLVDGYRGALRGIILSVVYPIYCAIWLAVIFGIFWAYVLVHTLIAGDQIIW